ncbi:TonB family protein [bacterium]|nr:TonB family protein [bacterium]
MAKNDLTSVEWCDVIFQGKNKEYGAYKMRMDSGKRHNWSMLIIVAMAALVIGVPKLIQLATPAQDETMTEVTTLSQLDEAEVKDEKLKKVEPIAPPPPPLKSSVKFVAPVIKKDSEVNEEDQMKSQEELQETKVTISIADVKGNDEVHGKDISEIKQVVTQAPVEEVEEKPYTAVEQMPQFPGGESELLKYIFDKLRYPTISQENGVQGKVYIRFVVSKTGEVKDAQVMRSLDPYCDKEALRVIRSLPRWIPGKQNGVNVPVYYVVPITFKLQ